MAAPFTPRADRVLRAGLLVLAIAAFALVWAVVAWRQSSPRTGVGTARAQPVVFSHELHAGRLAIDCRFCHRGVELGAAAGLPTVETCMTCHSQIWRGAAPLAPIGESFASGEPLSWSRLHDLGDHVRFHHAIHLDKGVGCETCHGRVDRMVETVMARHMTMAWCLDCHRAPERHLRPPDAVLAFGWMPEEPPDGDDLLERYGIEPARLSDCSICHY